MNVEGLLSKIRSEHSSIELLSNRQLKTISSIPRAKLDIHCGPYGCGKTYSILLGLGLACMASKPPQTDSCITLAGISAVSVKNNMCNPLASMFGKNFMYSSSKKDGYQKDALLFNHRIRIVGLKDANAEERIRGLNTYKIIGDEITTWGKTDDNFNRLQGRLRGEKPKGWELGFVGSTNPEGPSHWLKKIIDTSEDINYIQWRMSDNITSGAEEYYNKLKQRYKHNEAQYSRYLLGEWTAADGMVYKEFAAADKELIISQSDLDTLLSSGIITGHILGVDFGTTNATAILVIGLTDTKQVVVLKEYYINDTLLNDVVRIIRGEYYKYSSTLRGIYIDPAANVLSKQLIKEGIPKVYDGNNSVLDGINFVQDLFSERRLFICETCTNLIDELYSYSWSPNIGGTDRVVKINDHACDALRYALYTNMS